jgi:hypothetical protein
LAGDIRSLREHINVLREPLGATGFRSQESYENLIAQSVDALSNPDITIQTSQNTLKILRQLQSLSNDIIDERLIDVGGGSAVGSVDIGDLPALPAQAPAQ